MEYHKKIERIKREILSRLDVEKEYEALGLKFAGEMNEKSKVRACHNPFKKDNNPNFNSALCTLSSFYPLDIIIKNSFA